MKDTGVSGWGWVIASAVALAVVIVVVVSLGRAGGWWFQESAAEPSASPSEITLSAASPVAADPVTPAPTSSGSPASTETPVAEMLELDDAGWQAAEAVATTATTQLEDETDAARTARLEPLFATGATPPEPAWDLAYDIGVIAHGRVEPRGVQWAEPFDAGTAGVGVLISVQAQTFGVLDGENHNGVVDDGDIAWTDTSSQLWEVVMTRQDGRWVAASARLADTEGES